MNTGLIWLAAVAVTAPAPMPAVTVETARASLAGQWAGKLEYRDYQADKWFGLPVICVHRTGRRSA